MSRLVFACRSTVVQIVSRRFTWSVTMHARLKLSIVVVIGLSAAAFAAQQNSTETVAAGEALFFGKAGCASCHEVNGRGGVAGPDLSAAGQRPPETLQAKILAPNSPPALTIIAKMKDGREI